MNAKVIEALLELYTPEGVAAWLKTWLEADADLRLQLERQILTARDI